MKKLLLIKHSLPETDPARPAAEWTLGIEGRMRCEALAEALRGCNPDRVVTSREPKAFQTAQLIAGLLADPALPLETTDGLHEHERSRLGYLDRREFEDRVRRLFDRPQDRVMGDETADEAHRRFTLAVEGVLRAHPDETLAVVSHGTVLTLFVSRLAGLQPYPLWESLGLPSFFVLSRPELSLLKVVSSVAGR